MKDALSGGKTLMTEDEARAALMKLQTEMQAKQQAKAQQEGDANKKEGEAFLAANKGKEGVVTLPSGRQLSNHCTTSVGYASSSEPLVRFGLGKDTVAKLIQIHWLSGASQELHDIKADQLLKVREP